MCLFLHYKIRKTLQSSSFAFVYPTKHNTKLLDKWNLETKYIENRKFFKAIEKPFKIGSRKIKIKGMK